MTKTTYLNYLSNLAKENGFLKVVILVIALSNVCFGYFSLKALRAQKVIVTPIGYNEKIVVDGDSVNESYLIMFANYVFKLALEYQPSTIRQHYDMLKTVMSPRSYKFYEDEFTRLIDDVEIGQISSVFFINSMKHDPIKKVVKVTGVRRMYLEHDVVESADLVYALKYEVEWGRVFIKELGSWSDFEKYLDDPEGKAVESRPQKQTAENAALERQRKKEDAARAARNREGN
jgi:type IV conjugative transfer system protein TraE